MALTKSERDRRYYLKHGNEKNRKTRERYANDENFRKRKCDNQKEYYAEHSEYFCQKNKILKKIYAQQGRCTSCGKPLVQGEIKTCVNCGSSIKREFKYAKDSLGFAVII